MPKIGLAPTCLICDAALSGVLGALSRLGGIRRTRGNPNICTRCNGHIAEGRVVELAVFFADLSGYTSMTETLGPDRVHALLDGYLRCATDVVVSHDGYVSQFVGDEVMAFFNVPVKRSDFAERAVAAGQALQRALADVSKDVGHPLNVTIGIAAGHARVGRVGSESIAHYSAIGDVVNRAARLVSRVAPGGLLVDDAIYTDVAQQFPDAARERVALKGFSAPVGIALIEGSMVADDTPAVPRVEQTARLTTTLAALLSTPCVGYFALNSLAVWLGFGTLAAGALGTFLDQAIIRFPLLGVATLGGLTLLAVLFRHGLAAAKQDGIAAKPTPLERRRNLTGLVLALGALGLVVGELLLHGSVH